MRGFLNRCRDCNADLKGLRRCPECNMWQQSPHRWIVLFAKTAGWLSGLGTAFTACMAGWVYVTGDHSTTRCKVMSATQQTVVVKVWNAGKNPSVLTDAHLRFDAISSGEFPLQLGSDDLQRAVITSSTPINIVLALADERLLSSSQRLQQYKREKLIALRGSDPFGPQRMTLCIDVEEDGWWWTGGTHERCDRFPAARVSTFLEERVK